MFVEWQRVGGPEGNGLSFRRDSTQREFFVKGRLSVFFYDSPSPKGTIAAKILSKLVTTLFSIINH